MLYTNEMIKMLGYASNEEFIADYVKKHENCCIEYTPIGVWVNYDFDSK